MSKETIKLILDMMRAELKDRDTYLNSLKELTIKLRNNASIYVIQNEISGINKDIKNSVFSKEELEELDIINKELQNLINQKK